MSYFSTEIISIVGSDQEEIFLICTTDGTLVCFFFYFKGH